MNQRSTGQVGSKIVLQPVREMERCLFWNVLNAFQQRLVAVPADFDAAIMISFRARHLENALRFERRFWSKNFRMRLEAHARAASIRRAPSLNQLAFRLTALECHPVELLF